MKAIGPRLTAIGSGKGGTGKTFVSLALAQAFTDLGERVLVCDADLGLANTTIQLGLSDGGDLPGILAGRRRLCDAVVRAPGGFDLLAAPAGSGILADADGATAARLTAILRNADAYDRVLVDLGAGVADPVMTIAAQSDDIVVIATPDPTAITDAYAFIKLALRRAGGRAPAFAVNLAAGAADARRTAEALQNSARTFLKTTPAYLGFIPHDTRVMESIRRQTSLSTLYPQSPAIAAIGALAGTLGGQTGRLAAAASIR
jgi:flagellar biosynthesis protein FlhG